MTWRANVHYDINTDGLFLIASRDNPTGRSFGAREFLVIDTLKVDDAWKLTPEQLALVRNDVTGCKNSDSMWSAIFQALWDHGMRPKDHIPDKNALEMMDRHLQDMRALVFKGKQP